MGGIIASLLASTPPTLARAASPSASQGAQGQAEVLEIFTREGCPRCADAAVFVAALEARRPGLKVVWLDVAEPAARERLTALAAANGIDALGVPAFAVGEALLIGFDGDGARIEALLAAPAGGEVEGRCSLSDEGGCAEPGEAGAAGEAGEAADSVALPVFGVVSAGAMGLPLFTLALGLVDGFNPCAMWVLLFLMSVLAGLGSRRKMLMIGGTFVVVSGLVYFAFMAAWLNVFLLIGASRAVQVGLGIVAVVVSSIHIKDYFAPGKGPSLSIPAAVKPTIYARVRGIMRAEAPAVAIAGAAALAVLVNWVELLCTAGLPAIYTQVLAAHGLASWQRYAYLALYNLAYMFDDAVMVGIAVATLSREKLQERAGRQLKLLSGLVMLGLGLALIFAPSLLTG
ncbi:MAG: NrdH-redoxin [Nannocystis sp.]|nr:NrdH-redoxin [Nannocystis sp.]